MTLGGNFWHYADAHTWWAGDKIIINEVLLVGMKEGATCEYLLPSMPGCRPSSLLVDPTTKPFLTSVLQGWGSPSLRVPQSKP